MRGLCRWTVPAAFAIFALLAIVTAGASLAQDAPQNKPQDNPQTIAVRPPRGGPQAIPVNPPPFRRLRDCARRAASSSST